MLLGDGSQEPVTVSGDRLNAFDDLIKLATKYHISQPVGKAKDSLLKSLWNLEEGGTNTLNLCFFFVRVRGNFFSSFGLYLFLFVLFGFVLLCFVLFHCLSGHLPAHIGDVRRV